MNPISITIGTANAGGGDTPFDAFTKIDANMWAVFGWVAAVEVRLPIPYSGVTNSSGLYNVTFATPYAVPPNIQANTIGQSTEVQTRVVSVSTTGFSVHVYQRVAVLTLAISVATTNVVGANVDVLITPK